MGLGGSTWDEVEVEEEIENGSYLDECVWTFIAPTLMQNKRARIARRGGWVVGA